MTLALATGLATGVDAAWRWLAAAFPSPLFVAALLVAGLFAGFINAVAGGGSLLTLPALMLLGLPADVANGTNRVGVVAQSFAGLLTWKRAGKLDLRATPLLLGMSAFGAIVGSFAAAIVPPSVLKPALLGSMIPVAIAMVLKPDAVTAPEGSAPRDMREHPRALGLLFAASLYGGFVQGGVGFLLLAAFGGMLRYDLVRANALKLACTGIFGIVSLAIFAYAGQVSWAPGLVVAASTVVGGQVGIRFALKAKHKTMHYLVLACILATCAAAALKG